MNKAISEYDPLLVQLKQLIVGRFRLSESVVAQMTEDEPLFAGRLGLDSLDALEFALSIEDEFGLALNSAAESRRAFASLGSLAGCIRHHATKHPDTGLPPWPQPLLTLS